MSNDPKKTVLNYAIFLTVLLGFSLGKTSEAASPRRNVKEGNRHYQKGDYTAAREDYSQALKKAPESDIVNFNAGTAAYKEKQYEQATDHFQKVFLSENAPLKENAHYNLGNALYQLGMTQEQEDMDAAVDSLKNALGQYERALSMDKEDKDAQHNYDFVKKELMRLRQKQQQQKQQQKQDRQSQKDQENQEQQQDQQSQQKEGEQNQQQKQQKQEGQEEQQSQQQQSSQEQREKQKQGDEKQQEEQKQPGRKNEEQKDQEKSGQGRGQEGEEDYNKQQGTGGQPRDAQELTPKEAQMLLESYQRAEEPQGLLNVHPRAEDSSPVFKDW